MITLIDRIAIAATRLTLSPKSEQHKFFFQQYPYTITTGYGNFNYQREYSLIFFSILLTKSLRKGMEISLENFYVDIGT